MKAWAGIHKAPKETKNQHFSDFLSDLLEIAKRHINENNRNIEVLSKNDLEDTVPRQVKIKKSSLTHMLCVIL